MIISKPAVSDWNRLYLNGLLHSARFDADASTLLASRAADARAFDSRYTFLINDW